MTAREWLAHHPEAAQWARQTYTTFPGRQKHGVWQAIVQGLQTRGYPGSLNAIRMVLTEEPGASPNTLPSPQIDVGTTETPEVTHTSPLVPQALSEAEALALFQVDTTKWEVVKLTHNIWEVGQKGPDGEPIATPLCQTTLHLKRIAGADSLVALTDTLLQSLKQAAPPRGPFVITKTKAPEMLELCRPDLHWGKLGWSAETEAPDYDLTIARGDFHDAASDLFAKTAGYKFARIVIPSGNDEQHTDNLRSETTSGTRVDSDSRFHKMFRVAVEERIWLIRESLLRAPEVWDITISGNHDRVGAFTVGEVVRAHFSNEPRVHFDNEPPLRKYVRWGNTLLGYTHGSEEKHADLPLIMAQERPQDWAETLFRGWRLGHLHKRKQTRYIAGDSHMGVEVRIIASLSGTDAWHYQKGFVKQRRAMEAFVHHFQDGEVGAFLSRLPEAK